MNAIAHPIKSPMKTKAELALAAAYLGARTALPGGPDVAAQRKAAIDLFGRTGLPSRKLEGWKYTDLRQLMPEMAPLAKPEAMASLGGQMLAALGFRRLVIVNGSLIAAASDLAGLEAGLAIRSMAEALAADEPLLEQRLGDVVPPDDASLALNTAFAGDGVVLTVAPGAAIERPIHLVFVTTGERAVSSFTRSLAVIGADAKLTLVETHEGPDKTDYQVNAALQLVIGEGAKVEHVRVIGEGSTALHVGTLLAHVGPRATFNSLSFISGGAVIRNQQFIRLAGEGTVAGIRGVSLLSATQHADTTLAVDHAAPGGQSREAFKSVLDDQARAVFQGRITVRQAAQQTDAKMMSRALLLSDDARADHKPELVIFADDVQCGHGSTAGPLDDQLTFYLMARGIPEREARALLVQAFAAEVLDPLPHDGLREVLSNATAAWLKEH